MYNIFVNTDRYDWDAFYTNDALGKIQELLAKYEGFYYAIFNGHHLVDSGVLDPWCVDDIKAYVAKHPVKKYQNPTYTARRWSDDDHARVDEVIEIKPGVPGTYHIGSDSYPIEVVDVLSETMVVVRDMKATPAPGHNYYGDQKYNYSNDPDGRTTLLKKTADGWRAVDVRYLDHQATFSAKTKKCGAYIFGVAEYYQDPSF